MQIPLTSRAKLGTDSREVGCCIRYEDHMQRSNTACASILRQFFIFSYRDLRTREASPDCTTCNESVFWPTTERGIFWYVSLVTYGVSGKLQRCVIVSECTPKGSRLSSHRRREELTCRRAWHGGTIFSGDTASQYF